MTFDVEAARRLAQETPANQGIVEVTDTSCTCRNFGPHEYREVDANCAVHNPASSLPYPARHGSSLYDHDPATEPEAS